ncbi:MAG TPA: FAD-dependent oxidoreductase [Candidatus Sulfopaludibacter sp.]|nr:FAD-dependent oxidoreductase [Candidatus Sulfopaludibacter sp.]
MAVYDVIVIGAGVFGSCTAWRLCRAGRRVLLLDAWGPGHSRSSSGDESRIIRMGYGADTLYTRMAMRSLALWKELPDAASLFHQTGVLWLARTYDAYSAASQAALHQLGVRTEILSVAELSERYSQFHLPEGDLYGILEPESGVLLARRAVNAVVRDGLSHGLHYEIAAVQPFDRGVVRTAAGETLQAAQFVFACGPWLPKLFPELLGRRIDPTRQEVFYFAPPPGDARFHPPHFPAWIDFTDPRGPYGVPDLESRGVKIGLDRHGPHFDPDSDDRQATAAGIHAAREFLAERIPALSNALLTETRVCQYGNTSSGDFLLDRHPEFPHVWLAGGGSGHGFKQGPAVGEYLCSQMLQNAPAEPRFSLAAKQEEPRRTVY